MESLYRKYRPQTFDDVVGQQHVISTLERAVTEGRTSHAYLFCGPRGTGKTTMARILAKAMLCEKGDHELPDGTCEECRLIAAGEHPDVYELDAASRTGVDNVREEIISRVEYAPVRGRYKVYIIDEVHMLTPAAFNALLKTLEEPPEHVLFIMCTTDPQKILPTILSRVQRFDFRPIASDEMSAHLADICQQEGFTFEAEALELIVRHAHGGMRDAISTLEQLSVFGDGAITSAAARDLLGEVSDSRVAIVSHALANRDTPTLFAEVASLVNGGRDLLQFTCELMAHVRDVYVMSVSGAQAGVLDVTDAAEAHQLDEEAHAYGGSERLAWLLTLLDETALEMRASVNQRLTLEVALTRAARPECDLTLEAVAERLEKLEQRVEQGSVVAAPQVEAAQSASNGRASASEGTPVSVPSARPQKPAASVQTATAAVPSQPAPVHKPVPTSKPVPTPVSTPTPAPKPATASQPVAAAVSTSTPASVSQADAALQRTWKEMIDGLLKTHASVGSLLLSASITSDDGTTLTVSLPVGSAFTRRMLGRSDVESIVRDAVTAAFGARAIAYVEGDACSIARSTAKLAASAPAPAKAAQSPVQPTTTPAPAQASAPVRVSVPAQVPTSAPVPQSVAPGATMSSVPVRNAAVPEESAQVDDEIPDDLYDQVGAYDEEAQAAHEMSSSAPQTPVDAPSHVSQPAENAKPADKSPEAKSSASEDPAAETTSDDAPAADAPVDMDDVVSMLSDVFGSAKVMPVDDPSTDA